MYIDTCLCILSINMHLHIHMQIHSHMNYIYIYVYRCIFTCIFTSWQCAKLFWHMAMDAHCSRPSNTERLLLAVWLQMLRRIGDTPGKWWCNFSAPPSFLANPNLGFLHIIFAIKKKQIVAAFGIFIANLDATGPGGSRSSSRAQRQVGGGPKLPPFIGTVGRATFENLWMTKEERIQKHGDCIKIYESLAAKYGPAGRFVHFDAFGPKDLYMLVHMDAWRFGSCNIPRIIDSQTW